MHKTIEEVVGSSGTRGYGITLRELEPDAEGKYLASIYWHLQEFLVEENDIVEPHGLIAKSDNTGQSSGPHLHFGVKYYAKNSTGFYTLNINNGYHGYFDPMKLLPMTVNKEELIQLYLAVFGRLPDDAAQGYVGHDLLFVLTELMKSPEYQALAEVAAAIQHGYNVKL